MLQNLCLILHLGKLKYVGSLTLPCSKLMQPCGFAGHWEVFYSARGLTHQEKGGFVEGCCSAGGPHFLPSQLCCQDSQGTFTCPGKGPRGAQCLTPLQ